MSNLSIFEVYNDIYILDSKDNTLELVSEEELKMWKKITEINERPPRGNLYSKAKITGKIKNCTLLEDALTLDIEPYGETFDNEELYNVENYIVVLRQATVEYGSDKNCAIEIPPYVRKIAEDSFAGLNAPECKLTVFMPHLELENKLDALNGMFSSSLLKELDLSNFDFGSFTVADETFYGSEIDKIKLPSSASSIDSWNNTFNKLLVNELDVSDVDFLTAREIETPLKDVSGNIKMQELTDFTADELFNLGLIEYDDTLYLNEMATTCNGDINGMPKSIIRVEQDNKGVLKDKWDIVGEYNKEIEIRTEKSKEFKESDTQAMLDDYFDERDARRNSHEFDEDEEDNYVNDDENWYEDDDYEDDYSWSSKPSRRDDYSGMSLDDYDDWN